MAIFLHHPDFLQAGFGSHHPLSFPRHAGLLHLVQALGWLRPDEMRVCPLATPQHLARFHDADYLAAFETAARSGMASAEVRGRYNLGSMECPLFDGLWDRARATVGGSVLAAKLALAGEVAFHPAGGTHHGRRDRASGFCYLNDPVFAILTLLDAGLDRVLYVDLDAHHGDGVEAAFASDPRVMTISMHETGRWPGTGGLEDNRGGQALNLPVPAGLNDSEFDVLMVEAVLPAGQAFAAEAVVITCGTDALAGDPLSRLEVSNSALWDAVDAVRKLAPRAVVLGGGGYNPWTLARCWAGLWARLSGREADCVSGVSLPKEAMSVLAAFTCDLIDDDERSADWTGSIVDRRNDGPVRPGISCILSTIRNWRPMPASVTVRRPG